MTRYIIRRLLLIPVILFGATVLIFGFVQFLSPVERASLWVKDIPQGRDLWDAAIKQYCLDMVYKLSHNLGRRRLVKSIVDVHLISIAVIKNNGERMIRANMDNTISKALFAI